MENEISLFFWQERLYRYPLCVPRDGQSEDSELQPGRLGSRESVSAIRNRCRESPQTSAAAMERHGAQRDDRRNRPGAHRTQFFGF